MLTPAITTELEATFAIKPACSSFRDVRGGWKFRNRDVWVHFRDDGENSRENIGGPVQEASEWCVCQEEQNHLKNRGIHKYLGESEISWVAY